MTDSAGPQAGLEGEAGAAAVEGSAEAGASDEELLDVARRAIQIEARGVESLAGRLGPPFLSAVHRILACRGRVIVTGVGKSGLVARKIASTLASTGTPALFLHPTEGAHGDVGVLVEGDVLLVVSKSGATSELTTLFPSVRRVGADILALTGAPGSALGRSADVVLDASVPEEACPYDVAPTASSTAALALGDALALALMRARGLDSDDYARLHPGGSIGRRLLWTVADVMVTGEEAPRLRPDAPLGEAMEAVAHRRGTVAVVEGGRLVGVLTAGDLTRFASERPDFLGRPVSEAMNGDPKVAESHELVAEARRRMETHGIMALPVVDGGEVAGMVHLHDILRAGVGT
ncbi:MAG: KpsF/GutQ family sugar-phosphate isomerase [Gemmatimonadota bacterium]|nr:KpsF/GutQ family sugar-phosphate isomerase [Gemmatimonadota bacterium]